MKIYLLITFLASAAIDAPPVFKVQMEEPNFETCDKTVDALVLLMGPLNAALECVERTEI